MAARPALIGAAALSPADRRYQELERAFETDLMNQGQAERRSLDQTLALAWKVLVKLPRRDLTMLPAAALNKYYPAGDGLDGPGGDEPA